MKEARPSLHPAQRRWAAENLVRLRRSDEQRRYAAPQRAARVDTNPHQVAAVIFALARVREGGCILADEVGLGKTIEAGLVISQLMTEGARRILLITPKSLLGQWRQELCQLFDIDANDGEVCVGGLDGEGVFLIGREVAGGSSGRDALAFAEPFDLVVIDEAHEVFSGIWKRFDALGQYREDVAVAQTAGRIRDVLNAMRPPVLLLTATPIQNNLAELWGLVHYVDPLGTLLGDLPTFRALFCGADDRQLAEGQEDELRSRLRSVVQRTLRRDAQMFLEKPFVGREARLFEYTMSPDEKELYDDVTSYLLEPGILAFEGRHRQLLLLSFHRLLASSTAALASGLQGVARRLTKKIEGNAVDSDDATLLADLEEEVDQSTDSTADSLEVTTQASTRDDADPSAIQKELARVEAFTARARSLGGRDGKFRALLQAVEHVRRRPNGDGKLVIFTESRVTQNDLRERLVASRLLTDAEITLFAGTNDTPRAREALTRWRAEVPATPGRRINPDVATRLALVHEFRTRSRVLISTEAGAKGLNLQFCDTVVNYDLPWNPQRIEQRIGRCHRYGQQRDVTVVNFLAKGNLAQELTFEILSQKLELFGAVLDASDQVLHRPATGARGEVLASVLGAEFESELRRIYERSRTLEEVTTELRALRERVGVERRRYEEAHAKTAGLIETHFDGGIQGVLRKHKDDVPAALAELDRDLNEVITAYLDAVDITYERRSSRGAELLVVAPSPLLPEGLRDGVTVAIGSSKEHMPVSLAHPLVIAAVAHACTAPRRMAASIATSSDWAEFAGQRMQLRLLKLAYDGFEKVELLVPILVGAGDTALPQERAEALLRAPMRQIPTTDDRALDETALDDATDEVVFTLQAGVDAKEQERFERAAQQAERYIDDRLLVLRRRRAALEDRIEHARARRDGATGSEARTEAERALLVLDTQLAEITGAVQRLENRDDDTFRQYQEHIHRRRYTPPRVEHLFDLELVIE